MNKIETEGWFGQWQDGKIAWIIVDQNQTGYERYSLNRLGTRAQFEIKPSISKAGEGE